MNDSSHGHPRLSSWLVCDNSCFRHLAANLPEVTVSNYVLAALSPFSQSPLAHQVLAWCGSGCGRGDLAQALGPALRELCHPDPGGSPGWDLTCVDQSRVALLITRGGRVDLEGRAARPSFLAANQRHLRDPRSVLRTLVFVSVPWILRVVLCPLPGLFFIRLILTHVSAPN